MSINASVTLSIGELDSLRDKIKSLEKDVEIYKERERTVKIKVTETSIGLGIIDGLNRYGERIKSYGNVSTTVESYKNIDDIMEPLSQKAIEGVHKQLNSLNNQISTGTAKIAELEKKLREKTDEFISVKANQEHKTLEEKLSKAEDDKRDIEKDLKTRLDKLVSDYNDLAVRSKLDIDYLKSRKWYHLLFNKS